MQYRRGFEHRDRRSAVSRRCIHDRRDLVVRRDGEKFRLVLLAFAKIHPHHPEGQVGLVQEQKDLLTVRRRRVVQADHRPTIALRSPSGSSPFTRWMTLPFESAMSTVGTSVTRKLRNRLPDSSSVSGIGILFFAWYSRRSSALAHNPDAMPIQRRWRLPDNSLTCSRARRQLAEIAGRVVAR